MILFLAAFQCSSVNGSCPIILKEHRSSINSVNQYVIFTDYTLQSNTVLTGILDYSVFYPALKTEAALFLIAGHASGFKIDVQVILNQNQQFSGIFASFGGTIQLERCDVHIKIVTVASRSVTLITTAVDNLVLFQTNFTVTSASTVSVFNGLVERITTTTRISGLQLSVNLKFDNDGFALSRNMYGSVSVNSSTFTVVLEVTNQLNTLAGLIGLAEDTVIMQKCTVSFTLLGGNTIVGAIATYAAFKHLTLLSVLDSTITVDITSNGQGVGGVVGVAQRQTGTASAKGSIVLQNCLVRGKILGSSTSLSQLIGYIDYDVVGLNVLQLQSQVCGPSRLANNPEKIVGSVDQSGKICV